MKYELGSPVFEGASTLWRDWAGNLLPYEFTDSGDEFMATRTTASLGLFLSASPIFDIAGPDADRFLNYYCVNRDFSQLKAGRSRHALICNDKGQMLASGVVFKRDDGSYRTYWLAPAILFFAQTSGMDVVVTPCQDEYFFQLDGPKSLEILEKATQTNLHDLKFAQNKRVKICGTDMTVHRLGMSGALAYELHGGAENAETAFLRLREVLFEFGGRLQGAKNYTMVQHTPAGYPNQFQHFWYPFLTSGEAMAKFAKKVPGALIAYTGSASDDEENFFLTPYEVGWGNLVNFDKSDFLGREALLMLSAEPHRQMVTLEWDADDVGEVFTSQFRGMGVEPCERIEFINSIEDTPSRGRMRGDYVLAGGKKVGVATGKTYAFYERRMVSLACIDDAYAAEDTEVSVLWGSPGRPQKKIRAKVARYPYYGGEYRNETFDVEKIPSLMGELSCK